MLSHVESGGHDAARASREAAIVEAYQVLRVAVRGFDVDAGIRDDLVQASILTVIKHLDAHQSVRCTGTKWLHMVANSRFRDWLRKDRTRSERGVDGHPADAASEDPRMDSELPAESDGGCATAQRHPAFASPSAAVIGFMGVPPVGLADVTGRVPEIRAEYADLERALVLVLERLPRPTFQLLYDRYLLERPKCTEQLVDDELERVGLTRDSIDRAQWCTYRDRIFRRGQRAEAAARLVAIEVLRELGVDS